MSDSVDPSAHDQDLDPIGKIQWPSIMMTSEGEQNSKSPGSPTNRNEQLLDIEGLLDIERLVRNIKKEGRLESASNEQIRHGQISQMNRPKG